jgi:predicted MFS family arabinose efflux permease
MTAFGIGAMIGARMSGKLGRSLPQKNLVVIGFTIASAANVVLYFLGHRLEFLILGVTLLGFGLMLAYSTILTIATEFAAQARGAAMSLAAFCFMGGGGVGTAIGGKVIDAAGFNLFYLYYGLCLIALAALAAIWVTVQEVSKAPIEAVG